MSIKRRIERLEQMSTTSDAPVIALVFADGATVDGEDVSIEEYEERVAAGAEPAMVTTVGGIGMSDI